MKTIVLTGKGSKGKTSTLFLVYEKLIMATNDGKGTKFVHLGAENTRDFFDIVKYKNKKIAVYTMGDCSSDLSTAQKKATNGKCDLVICAINDQFKNKLNMIPNDCIIQKTSKSSFFSAFESNMFDCYRILRLIEEKIK